MKLQLYIDFDGVILNTIEVMDRMMEEAGVLLENSSTAIQNFYLSIDWEELIPKSEQIHDSIRYIKKIMDSGLYEVHILTHVNSLKEVESKVRYLHGYIPNLDIIPVKIGNRKCDAVECRNAILVDDYTKNLEYWQKNGGIPVKFSLKDKKYEFMTIGRLDVLLEKYSEFLEIIGTKN